MTQVGVRHFFTPFKHVSVDERKLKGWTHDTLFHAFANTIQRVAQCPIRSDIKTFCIQCTVPTNRWLGDDIGICTFNGEGKVSPIFQDMTLDARMYIQKRCIVFECTNVSKGNNRQHGDFWNRVHVQLMQTLFRSGHKMSLDKYHHAPFKQCC